jgi:hypothetical protein
MAKPCCENSDPKPPPYWKVWSKRIVYAILIGVVLFVLWSQFMHQQ